MSSKHSLRWCAVYTRKSSEEGLEQQFNSLDAQREAGKAYVKSQQHEGWRSLMADYDDGGHSGGTLERPALQRLLIDIRAGKVQIVVVYKVDRLTRSLSDFAKLIDVFDAHGVSFVSVTQQFNTTTSMGRLMLNVLLSFAQFEREVTGERIRDKIAASKKKGMWMGGTPPLGYDVKDRKLLVNEAEAQLARHIFRRYVELGTVAKLMVALASEGHRTKRYIGASGRSSGGCAFRRDHLYRMLGNRTYRGEVVHQGISYPGAQNAIVDGALWDSAQALLKSNRQSFLTDERVKSPALLKGLIFDGAGNRMSPSHAVKQGQRYLYYVSQAVLQGRAQEAGSVARLPASNLEQLVINAVWKKLGDNERTRVGAAQLMAMEERGRRQTLRGMIRKVEVFEHQVMITIDPSPLDHTAADSDSKRSQSQSQSQSDEFETIAVPFKMIRRGGGTRVILAGDQPPTADASTKALVKALIRGYRWRQQLLSGEVRSMGQIAKRSGVAVRYVSRLLRLSFLAPDIVEGILDRRLPGSVTLESVLYALPYDWNEQRRLFGLRTADKTR